MNKNIVLFSIVFIGLFCFINIAEAITYGSIDKKCNTMTDAQFTEYAKSTEGTRVSWTGAVTDVTENWLDDEYEVNIDMDDTGVYDVSFDVSKSLAMQLKKKSSYSFTGTIKSVTCIFGGAVVSLKGGRFK